MEEIITDEFIRYKAGFIQGRCDLIEAVVIGKMINLSKKEEVKEENWFTYGEEDALKYYGKLIDTNNLDLEKENTRQAVKECFAERVIRMNEEQEKEVPIGKFRI